MKQLEYRALKALIYIYEFYLKSPESEHVAEDAKRIYNEYDPASTLLPEKVNRAVNFLFSMIPAQSERVQKAFKRGRD